MFYYTNKYIYIIILQDEDETKLKNQILKRDTITSTSSKKQKKEQTGKDVDKNNKEQDLAINAKSSENKTIRIPQSLKSIEDIDGSSLEKTKSKGSKKKIKSDKGEEEYDLSNEASTKSVKENGLNALLSSSNKSSLKRLKRTSESSIEDNTSQPLKKPKNNMKHSKNLETLTESGFQWDVKLEDLNKPVEESVKSGEEVSAFIVLFSMKLAAHFSLLFSFINVKICFQFSSSFV